MDIIQNAEYAAHVGQMTFAFSKLEPRRLPHTLELLTRHGWLRAVKQPIFRLHDEAPVAYEFLIRTSIPGYSSPETLLKYCLQQQSLQLADMLCMTHCLAGAWLLPQQFRRHINLYPSTIAHTPVERILEAFPARINPGSFCLELNENCLESDPVDLMVPIKALKRAGILIAIDDVGFGKSSLESLVYLEPDIIKIDKSFISGAAQNRERLKNLKRLLSVARSLGAQAIAEGIETAEDLAAVKNLGVSHGQGYLWGKPA